MAGLLMFAATVCAQKPENVLVVVNQESALSKTVGDYYVLRRHIPLANVCHIHAPADEYISRDVYDKQIAASVEACLKSKGLTENVLYIVTTAGVPLRVEGPGDAMNLEKAAVD